MLPRSCAPFREGSREKGLFFYKWEVRAWKFRLNVETNAHVMLTFFLSGGGQRMVMIMCVRAATTLRSIKAAAQSPATRGSRGAKDRTNNTVQHLLNLVLIT